MTTERDHLLELERALDEGVRRSRQGSLSRRLPAPEAMDYLERARHGLRELVARNPEHAEAWALLSRAEECLLDYERAIQALERVVAIHPPAQREQLKKLALLRQSAAEWAALGLTPVQLEALGEYLRRMLQQSSERSLHWTRSWLDQSRVANREAVLAALQARGGYSDLQVLENVIRG